MAGVLPKGISGFIGRKSLKQNCPEDLNKSNISKKGSGMDMARMALSLIMIPVLVFVDSNLNAYSVMATIGAFIPYLIAWVVTYAAFIKMDFILALLASSVLAPIAVIVSMFVIHLLLIGTFRSDAGDEVVRGYLNSLFTGGLLGMLLGVTGANFRVKTKNIMGLTRFS